MGVAVVKHNALISMGDYPFAESVKTRGESYHVDFTKYAKLKSLGL